MKDSTPVMGNSSEGIALRLTEAVHEHRVLPGMKLSEDEVGEIFGVSRTLVRQALRAMAHEGLVSIERNRGAFVAKPSVKEAREVFEARALLEPQTARAAAERATVEDVALLEKHIEREHAALAAGEAGRALKLSGLFHVEIARVADQRTIEAFIQQLVSRSSLVIALYWQRKSALCESHAHHALLDAFRENDPDKAEELMKGHLVDLVSQLNLREMPEDMKALFLNGAEDNLLEVLGQATGVDPDNLPDRMDTINNLLNQMPAPVRDKLLADFVNRLYSNA